MNVRFLVLVTLFGSLLRPAFGTSETKDPAFFESRYGSAETSIEVSKEAFLVPAAGSRVLKDKFRILTFRKDSLNISAAFSPPTLSLARVNLSCSEPITEKQAIEFLQEYGEAWKPLKVSPGSLAGVPPPKVWIASDGSLAFFEPQSSTVHIQSSAIVRRLAIASMKTSSADT